MYGHGQRPPTATAAVALAACVLPALLVGCGGQTKDQLRLLLEEITFVRAELKAEREQLNRLRREVRTLTTAVERLKAAEATLPPLKIKTQPLTTTSVTKVGTNSYRIKRAELNRWLANTDRLASSARIVPTVLNGKPAGFKLYAIRPDSLYRALGLQNGDNIYRVNGHDISTPDRALNVYVKLRAATKVTIDLRRRGRPLTMRYEIVP